VFFRPGCRLTPDGRGQGVFKPKKEEVCAMKIMFCHDGADRGHRALEMAVDYFKPLKPEMVLLCVVDDVVDASMEVDAITDVYREECRDVLDRSAKWVMKNGLEVDVVMASGDPRRMIVEAIGRKSPDVVVIARKEKSEAESVFRRSVSAHLVKNAGCHLFIMGPVDRSW